MGRITVIIAALSLGASVVATPVLANDCSGAADQARQRTGGEVLSVSSRKQGGKTVCVVTVLIPGKDGGRPRRTTLTIPM